MSTFKNLFESAVGLVGRTGAADAKAHVGPELRAQFKKIVKQIGGLTAARQLLAELQPGFVFEDDKEDKEDKEA